MENLPLRAFWHSMRTSSDSAGQTFYLVGGSIVIGPGFPEGHGDLRGYLSIIHEDTGEVVGQFDDIKFTIEPSTAGARG